MDHLSKAGRSRVMASIRSKNTRPELALRAGLRLAGALGYRVHIQSLPGRPDIAYTRWQVAIFVDGAYWHGHPDHFHAERASPYWRDKIAGNKARDQRINGELASQGWSVLRFWDFDVLSDTTAVVDQVTALLRSRGWRGPTTGARESQGSDPRRV